MNSIGYIMFCIGCLGALGSWLGAIRPYIRRSNRGANSAANLGVGAWVDWQTCKDLAEKHDDPYARKLVRVFGFAQLLALVGGVFGFLPFNRHPARIFMGDAGSMLLGFSVAALMILFAEQIPRWWMASIVVFGLPILDTATALA